MAESETSLAQRVESLERTSHERVVEQVADLGERVTGLESARDAENPHLATKADIARLELRIETQFECLEALQAKKTGRNSRLDTALDRQGLKMDAALDAQTDQVRRKLDECINRALAVVIIVYIVLTALILSQLSG